MVQPLYCEVITAIPILLLDHKCMAVPRHRQCAGPGGGGGGGGGLLGWICSSS